jgi:hypothetical protein
MLRESVNYFIVLRAKGAPGDARLASEASEKIVQVELRRAIGCALSRERIGIQASLDKCHVTSCNCLHDQDVRG